MKRLDIIFSSNAKMLKYQLSLAAGVVDVPAHVLFNPIAGDQKNYPPPSGNDYKFLYTGSVYGGRTVKHVFEALKIALRKEKNLYLVFVGTNISDTDMAALNEVERKHVLIEPFSENLDRFYQESIALLDIDADISNDVFLSSKVTNYLAVNRIIISETGHNSPASDLFSGLTSIIQCPHDSSKIAEAMIFAVENAKYMRFDDRLDLLKAFSVRSVVDRIQDVISLEME